MRYRPTPETDEEEWDAENYTGRVENSMVVDSDFARRLERERDDAREQWRLSSACRIFQGQRDKLAEALQAADECLALIEDAGHGAHMDNVTVARGIIQKALAAVEEAKP